MGPTGPIQWSFAPADDDAHALLVGRRSSQTGLDAVVYALEADRAPIDVRRGDGEPLAEVDAAVRMGGRWYVASSQSAHELPATVVWVIEGSVAREVARVPRAGMEGKPLVRLARRSDSRAIGLVVDGQPYGDQPGPQRWVLPIDADSFIAGEPERIGSSDMRDRALAPCTKDTLGWVLDAPLNVTARLRMDKGTNVGVSSPLMGRVRVTRDSACVERIAANLDYMSSRTPDPVVRKKGDAAPAPKPEAITVSVTSTTTRQRFPLRCTKR
jgi:hypothetical protein